MKNIKSEKLFDTIGFVDDDLVKEAELYISKSQAKQSRFRFNYVYTSLAAMCAVVLVVAGLAVYVYNSQPEPEPAPSDVIITPDGALCIKPDEPEITFTETEEYKPTPPPELIYEAVELPAHLENLNWLIKPGFEYGGVHYCDMCDVFMGSGALIINERTGLYTEFNHGAHGGSGNLYIYDPTLDLMGINGSDKEGTPIRLYPRSEFTEHFPDAANSLILVRSVDSTAEKENEWDHGLPWEAFAGRGVAVAVENEFVTDFVYNIQGLTPEDWRWFLRGRANFEKIEVADINNKYGVIGRDGRVVLPFEFESLLVIDRWTAFVMYSGRWGIVAFSDGDVPDFTPSGEDNTYINGD
jgi:hypothetical protein